MKFLYFIPLFVLFIFSCGKNNSVVDQRINPYLDGLNQVNETRGLADQLDFWEEKLEQHPNNSVYQQKQATLLASLFRQNHKIEDLTQSTEILKELLVRFPNNVSIHHALVGNYITQHSFMDALYHVNKALEIGEKKYSSQLMLIDLYLEMGAPSEARKMLENLGNENRFDEQIRWVKLLDTEGDLDAAIEMMEQALNNASEVGSDELLVWSHSNLGDMYGHQGEINKSYDSYLKALEISPRDAHSLKGIGWIAYSQDKDYDKASEIWSRLKENSNDPELDLLLSEVYEVKGDLEKSNEHEGAFISQVNSSIYGNMYGSYLIGLFDKKNTSRALELAISDLKQREHPMTYCHFAQALHNADETERAIEILYENVLGRTEEPDAYYIAGTIFHDGNNPELAKDLLEEALEASYELGPKTTSDLNRRLTNIQKLN